MELVKILVFALSYVTLCNATKRSLLQYHIVDRSAETNPVNSNCICIPRVDNSHMLLDMIAEKGIGIKRVVTYFYINSLTQKITAYTPNIAKQQIFPDMSFDVGDDFRPVQPEDNVNNIIKLNPNKVERTKDRHYSMHHLKTGGNLNDAELTTNTPNIISLSETDSINVVQNENYPFKESVNDSKQVTYEIISPENNAVIHANPDMEVLNDIHFEPVGNKNTLNQILSTQNSGYMTSQNINYKPDNFVDRWETINNKYKWKDYIFGDKDHKVLGVKNVQRPDNFKLDQWFQQQIDSTSNNQIQNGVNFSNNDALKTLVYENLFKNGIIIMDNGILKTHQGDTLNLSNLKLQPALVGLSLGYNYPTTGVHGKMDSPYYNAMVLYMIHPKKVLDIIPMNSGHNHESMGYATLNLNKLYPGLMTSTALKTHCMHGRCYTNTIAHDFPVRSGRPEIKEINNQNAGVNGRSVQEAEKSEVHSKIYHDIKSPLNLINFKQMNRMKSTAKLRRIPVINDLLAKLYTIFLDEDEKIGDKSPKYEVRTIEDEGPDIRIIGGSAATGSGTPVSSRGRSAFH